MKKESAVYGLILIFCMAILLPAFAETAQNIPDILQNAVAQPGNALLCGEKGLYAD